nr:MAG TPA: hypothetical protein [Caudoviricetes sp.]
MAQQSLQELRTTLNPIIYTKSLRLFIRFKYPLINYYIKGHWLESDLFF